jgi:RNA polymerase sigma-70 factor (ECF subfamily)
MMNHQVFEQTALPHMNVLHTYAFHLTMNSDNAKDLLQETYLKAYRFWDNFEKGSNIKAWLYCIMRNSYINYHRREAREPKKVEYQEYHLPYNTMKEISFDQKDLLKKTYNEIFGDEIAHSIDTLKSTYKDILVLSDVEGLSYKEIASIVGCPIGTVRSRLFRSRKLLQKKLFNYARKNGYIFRDSLV